jgi:hypothetical protein
MRVGDPDHARGHAEEEVAGRMELRTDPVGQALVI